MRPTKTRRVGAYSTDLPQSRGIYAAVAFVLGATCVPLLNSSHVPTSSASFTAATANLPVGRAMKFRHIIRFVIPTIGTIHFGFALYWWYVLLFRVLGLEALGSLPADHLLLCIVLPFVSCLVLLAGFVTALYFTDRNSRFACPLTVAVVGTACVLFALSATSSAAQVHVFGRPGLNHFYATWWLYSKFPPLSIGGRALVAVAILVPAILLVQYCKSHDTPCRPTQHGR